MHKTWESLQHVHYPAFQFTRQVYPQSICWLFVLKFLQVLVQPKSEAGTPDWEDAVSQSTKKSSVKTKATLSLCCNLYGSDCGNRSHVLVISVAPVPFSNETKQICAGQDCSNTSKLYFLLGRENDCHLAMHSPNFHKAAQYLVRYAENHLTLQSLRFFKCQIIK